MAFLTIVAFEKGSPPLPQPSQNHPRELLKLIEACWSHDPANRKSLDEILDALLHIEKFILPAPTNSNNATQIIKVDPTSPEFARLLDSFNDSMQQHHSDYVASRIQKGLKPVSNINILI